MQTGLQLPDLARRLHELRERKHDFIAPTNALQAVPVDGAVKIHVPERGESFALRQSAHDQIAGVLGIPGKYYNRMRADAPELLAANINEWLGRSTDRRMVRTIGGEMRALLSDRYQRIENEEIAAAVLPILMSTPGIEVTSCQVTDQRMYIQATTPAVRGDVRVGDTVQAGVAISNSEIGQGAVSIRAMIWRLVCKNGAIAPDGRFAARHVGRRISADDDLNAIFSDEAKAADDRAILLKARDVVRASLDEAQFGKTLEKLRGLTEPKIGGDPNRTIEVLAQKVGITEKERGGLLSALISGGDTSAWGLINAVISLAHGGDYDRAVELEQIGGSMIDLSAREWREILEPA